MTDDFSKHPMSITEARASKAGKASIWTPRDALIQTLREIDSGEISPDCCIIVMGKILPDGTTFTETKLATQNAYVAYGLLERARYLIENE